MSDYFRPLVRHDPLRPAQALPVAGGPGWCIEVEHLRRDRAPVLIAVDAVPQDVRDAISAPRAPVAGVTLDRPRLMGILNITPDSFSDGGVNARPAQAVARGRQMVVDGADILDVGGESTRPGARTVPIEAEIARVEPVIAALAREHTGVPISVDTRKSCVADAALVAGAAIVNDVSGFTYDKALARLCARKGVPVCIMHARGDPETMQDDPRYDDVLLDVYDFLAAQVIMLERIGIGRSQILIDPGIGFGKTMEHNLAILRRISLFHSIGCPILLGASRKRFIGVLSGVDAASERIFGSVAVAQDAVGQGVQVLRVHDVGATRQAIALWGAINGVAT